MESHLRFLYKVIGSLSSLAKGTWRRLFKRISEEIQEKGSQAAQWWCTGQRTTTCLVCIGLSGGTSGSLRREAHNGRSQAMAPDCPVCTGHSGNGRIQRSTDVARAPDCLGSGRIQRSTATDPKDQLTWKAPDTVQCAPDYPVCPSIESCCFLPNS
jgi:hypothetical protein